MSLSAASLSMLARVVARHGGAGGDDLATLAEAATERHFAKGETFLAAGEQARFAGLVVDGIQGEFYVLANGTRKAKWLAMPGDVFGSLEDLVRVGPALTTIEALSDGTVLCMPYARLRAIAAEQPRWAAFLLSLVEDLYRKKSEREYALLMLDAPARYQWFLDRFAALEGALSQEVVASYLGISAVHLSRVRAVVRQIKTGQGEGA